MYGENGGVAELCVTVGRLRSDGVYHVLPKVVICNIAKKMAGYPCWALVPLLDLSRPGTRGTRQLVRGTDLCLASKTRSGEAQTQCIHRAGQSKDGQSD
jgi:hypothetical protein